MVPNVKNALVNNIDDEEFVIDTSNFVAYE